MFEQIKTLPKVPSTPFSVEMLNNIRYRLLQVRNSDDPMRQNEVDAFARVLETTPDRIHVFDLLSDQPSKRMFDGTDMFLLGGSGHYSAAGDTEWLDRALDLLREVHRSDIPTFASCWGFQAMARAMGGQVVNDLKHAEVGTHRLFLTEAGRCDPVFGPMETSFYGQMGHEDRVLELPPDTTLLAFTELVDNQAYRFDNRPIYCTQFHPELNRADLVQRVRTYPEYIARIARMPPDDFCETIQDTTATEGLLKRFVALYFGS